MPLYDFQCEKCGQHFEENLPMGSSVKPKCPQCGSLRTTKVFSAAGIQFKGSGFYVTDSKSGGSTRTSSTAPAGKTETAEQPAENTPAESKPAVSNPAESKPAQPSPAKPGGSPPAKP